MIAYGGYGDWKYSRSQLARKIELLKIHVPNVMQIEECNGVVLHGSSGVWLGAALVLNNIIPGGCGLFLVRKLGEQSHGEIVEGDGRTECERLLMIDDFVSTGSSVERVQNLIVEFKTRPAMVVAVLQHERINFDTSYKNRQVHKHSHGECRIY